MQISRRLLGLSRLCISARVVYPPAVSWALARMHKQHTCGRLKAPIGSLQSLAYLKSGAETSSYSCSRIQAQLHRARDARQRQQRHTCRVAEQPSLTHAYSSQAVSARQAANQQDSTPQRLVLVDAFALLYRSHFSFGATSRMRTSEGVDTSVLYGFMGTLLALLESSPPPTHFAVVFDGGYGASPDGLKGKTFRHELYEGYKAQRPSMPPEIGAALPMLTELLDAMKIPTMRGFGLEADDIIATMAVRGVKEGLAVEIASPDKDFNQLLRDGITLLRPRKSNSRTQLFNRYTADSFRNDEDWGGLEPSQFADVLALMGDASDNIPGVAGIGKKIAVALLQEFGDLDTLLASAEQVTRKKVRETLLSANGVEAARLSHRLVKLHTDIQLPDLREPLDNLRLQLPSDAGSPSCAAMDILGYLELKQHSKRLQKLYTVEA